MEPAAVSPSCPRCGADCRPGAERCGSCGFAFLEAAEGGARGRTGALSVGVVVVAVGVFVAVLAGGDEGQPAGAAPAALPALEAERRLELRFGGPSDDEKAAVRCPTRIDVGRIVRCELRYADGIPRAMLVRLTRRGELEADIPYPATIRR